MNKNLRLFNVLFKFHLSSPLMISLCNSSETRSPAGTENLTFPRIFFLLFRVFLSYFSFSFTLNFNLLALFFLAFIYARWLHNIIILCTCIFCYSALLHYLHVFLVVAYLLLTFLLSRITNMYLRIILVALNSNYKQKTYI